jgi:hypothetical protein
MDREISCVFNYDATLLLGQRQYGDTLVETDDTIYGAEAFQDPFCIFTPHGSYEHLDVYPFFENLINNGIKDDITPQSNRPEIDDCESRSFTQSIGHGAYSKLSFHFAKSGLVGIRAGAHTCSIKNPIVWINALEDETATKMKQWALSR